MKYLTLLAALILTCMGFAQLSAPSGLTRTQASSVFIGDYTVISLNPGQASNYQTNAAGSIYSVTSRTLFELPKGMATSNDLRAVWFGGINFNANSQINYSPAPNPVKVRADVFTRPSFTNLAPVSADAPIGYFTFGGSSTGLLEGGKFLWGDYHGATLTQGQPYFVHAYEYCGLQASPPAPAITASGTGSSFAGGTTYYVSIRFHYPSGDCSQASAFSTGVSPASGQNIVVTAPLNPANGADGYEVYLSNTNSTSYPAYDVNIGVVPFGTNANISVPFQSGNTGWLPCVYATGSSQTVIYGSAIYGGSGIGGRSDGEGYINNADCTFGSQAIPQVQGGNCFAPNAILCRAPSGTWRSYAIWSDSIGAGTGDNGFGGSTGVGAMARAVMAQSTSLQFNPSIIQSFGHVQCSVGGDTAKACATNQGNTRAQIANLCTDVLCGLGTNDLSYGVVPTIANLQSIALRHLNAGRKWHWWGLIPRGGTSDAYTTLTNQNLSAGAQAEAARRAMNNWGNDTSSQGPTFNQTLAPGDGLATTFYFSAPIISQTELVKVNGTTSTYNASPSGVTQYSEVGLTTVGSTTWVKGVTFGSAPAYSASITVASAVNEQLFRGFTGNVGPTANIYGFADGAATQYWFNRPILSGSEAIYSGGLLCTYSASPSGATQYSYLLTGGIGGSTWVSGIQFGSAPPNLNSLTYTGVKLAGLPVLLGTGSDFINSPVYFGELNSSGTLQMNGGFAPLGAAPVIGAFLSPHTLTATSANGFTDTSLGAINQDQYAGYSVTIIADSVNPAAAGQTQCIATNTTAGVFTCGAWTVQPSASATYVISLAPMQTTTHPTSYGYMNWAAALRKWRTDLFPY